MTAHEGASATNEMNVEVHKCDDAEVATHMQWNYFDAAAVTQAKPYSDAGLFLLPKFSRPMAACRSRCNVHDRSGRSCGGVLLSASSIGHSTSGDRNSLGENLFTTYYFDEEYFTPIYLALTFCFEPFAEPCIKQLMNCTECDWDNFTFDILSEGLHST